MRELSVSLAGTVLHPDLKLKIGFTTPLPVGGSAQDWVRALDGRRFDPEDKSWVITGLGVQDHPDDVLDDVGITVQYPSHGPLSHLDESTGLDELWRPMIQKGLYKDEWIIYPRLAGFAAVRQWAGPAPIWDKKTSTFTATSLDVLKLARHLGDRLDDGVLEQIEAESQEASRPFWTDEIADAAAVLARHNGVDEGLDEAIDVIADALDEIPGWYGQSLRSYQEAGAYAMIGSRTALCDEPGSGKCVHPQTRVLVNGSFEQIESLWSRYAQSHHVHADHDGVGEIIELGDSEVIVPALQEGNRAELVSASHLYREHVDTTVKTITTASGARITSTLPHRFLTQRGWVNEISVGDMVAVPGEIHSRDVRQLDAMLSSSVRWTRVTSVEHWSYTGWVYDLTVPDGANYVAEGLWSHNTRMSLAASSILRTKRLIIVVPPLVLTNWARETQEAMDDGWAIIAPDQGPALNGHGKPHSDSFGAYARVYRAGRKPPELPEVGAVIVPDSLLASRPELLDALIDYQADAVIFDEVHRARTWDNLRSTASRRLANSLPPGRRFALTGTPLLASPHEMMNLLQITGHLGPIFGGASAFLERYTSEDRFGGRYPKRKMLPELGQILDEQVWVRRTKADILPDLPEKVRGVVYVDVDDTAYRAAHADLYLKALDWADERRSEGQSVDFDAAHEWAKQDSFGLSTPLRVAAGLSKIPSAIEWIENWLEQTTRIQDGKLVCDRPLVVWVHHKQVMSELRQALQDSEIGQQLGVGVIDGSTGSGVRQRIADDFQGGRTSVLLCSIIAAGFGITLTRASDALFVEQDWTPAHIVQAEDRLHRFTQESTVMCTTMLAEGTLDPKIRTTLTKKSQTLGVVMSGSDTAVTQVTDGSGDEEFDTSFTEAEVIAEIVMDTLANPPSKAELRKARERRGAASAGVLAGKA